jgi:hypothetical protein
MLGDTISITISGATKVFTKIRFDDYATEYLLRESLVEYRVKVRHTKAADPNKVSQDRHNVELTQTTFATSTLPEYTEKAYFVMQANPGRSTVAMIAGLMAWATASSNANLTKLEGWES